MSFQRVRESRRQKSYSRSTSRPKASLQKPNGVISPRVKKVGGEHFGIVCVDPAKNCSEWMLADFFGNLLIEPQCLEHQGERFRNVMQIIRDAQQEHHLLDMIVVVERTGNYYLPPKRAFLKAGFETRIVHPFATKQYRVPADPGVKTDETDLYAMHRAAVAGFGLLEQELESPYRELQLCVRHRRNLVQKAAAMICQIREHLHLCMPGYARLFHHLFESAPPLAIARYGQSAENMVQLGASGLNQLLSENNIRHHRRTVDRTLAWARQPMRHPCFQEPRSILMKLQTFHQSHETPVDVLLEEMALAIEQFPVNTRRREAEIVAVLLEERAKKKRDVSTIGELLPAVLARLGVHSKQEGLEADNENGDRP